MNLMKSFFAQLFRWKPSRETLIAFAAGTGMIGLSIVIGAVHSSPWISIAIRDLGQISLGIVLPLVYIRARRDDFAEFGFSWKRWYVFLPINLILGILLLLMFLSEAPPPSDFRLDASILWQSAFILLAVIFELVFFYGFLRTLFERAFGIVPAIILCAAFYSLHHAGFQPEFGKLFMVGLIFAAVYRSGNSVLLLYPFLAGVGAIYDVLIQSQVVGTIQYPEIRTVYLTALLLGTAIWVYFHGRRPMKAAVPAGGTPDA
jgi:membrane protease YdiL (CAAX protease family)